MKIRRLTANVYECTLGQVNFFLIDEDELTLIDTATPGSAGNIMSAIRRIGRDPFDLQHILLTHSHPDHAGSVADLKALTGAKVYMHAAETELLRNGFIPKPVEPFHTGFISRLTYQLLIRPASGEISPCETDVLIEDGDWLPLAGGMHAIHIPGHSAGQMAFFLPGRKNVLFAADAAMNLVGLGYAVFYDNMGEAAHSLERLATFDFDIVCFGHGKALLHNAAERFRRKFMRSPHEMHHHSMLAIEEKAIVHTSDSM